MEPSSVDFTKLTREFREIVIPVDWGHIAAKWWGPADVQPIVALHGWHDNANTWDPLMNMMPPDLAFMAIDMPGNGLSSHFPNTMWYHAVEDIVALRAICKHFQWREPVTFLCHSYATGHAFNYAASYPDEVKKVIAIDFITPVAVTHQTLVKSGGRRLDRAIDSVVTGGRRPAKTLVKHAEDYCKANNNGISLEGAMHVLQRSMERVPEDPSLFRSTRDGRNSTQFYYSFPNDFILALARQIKCEYYVIRVTLPGYAERLELMFKGEEILRSCARRFELVHVEGTHHVHLDHPERVIEPILRWLRTDAHAESPPAQPHSLNRGRL